MISEYFYTLLRILEFVIAIGLLAFLHELGHFLSARLFKIEVEEFGFGFPPRIGKKPIFKLWGTEFSLNWIPFGAFVRPKGENDPEVPGGLAAAPPVPRLIVLLGGPLMNLLTGILLFSLIFTRTGSPDLTQVQILGVAPNSPAEIAGLKEGDIILRVNDENITSTESLFSAIRSNVGLEITIQLIRGTEKISIKTMPRKNPPAGEGALGITMGNPVKPIGWFQAIPLATEFTFEQGRQLFLLPVRLIRGQIESSEAPRVIGPIGMFGIYQQAREEDEKVSEASQNSSWALNTLGLMAVISVALGFTNLLPIPALDGGRILFVLPEILIRKRIPARYENVVHTVGFFLLISLMVIITAQDIFNPILPR